MIGSGKTSVLATTAPGPDEVEELAADWLARREFGLTVEEQAQFSQWLLADPRHAEAVKQTQAAWHLLQTPRFTGQATEVLREVAKRTARRARGRRWMFAGFAAAAASIALVFILPGQNKGEAGLAARQASVQVKPEQQILPDGSVVEFNAGTEIEVSFTAAQRAVRLVRGAAHFRVAKNPMRPFVVTAGAVSVRAVGTEFLVNYEVTAVDVLVTEGRVAVQHIPGTSAATAAPLPAPIMLDAGSRLTLPVNNPDQIPPQARVATTAEIDTALAWRNLRVEFTDTPLSEVVALFNRQNPQQLSLGDPALGDVRISGIFWADDPEGFSRLIEASAGLHAIRESADRITLRRPR